MPQTNALIVDLTGPHFLKCNSSSTWLKQLYIGTKCALEPENISLISAQNLRGVELASFAYEQEQNYTTSVS